MPNKYYVQNDEGEFVEATPDAQDVPDDTFYNDERYQEVADRDYQRRQKNKELQEELERLRSESETVDSEDADTDADETPKEPSEDSFDPDVLEQRLMERVLNTINERQKQEQEREKTINNLLQEYKLPDDVRDIVEGSNDPENVAKKLSQAGLRFDDAPSGDSTEDEIQAALKRVDKRLFGED